MLDILCSLLCYFICKFLNSYSSIRYTDHLPDNFPKSWAHELGKLAKAYRIPRLEKICHRLENTVNHLINTIPESQLQCDLVDLVDNPELSDIVLFTKGGEKVHAHKAILSARCS